MKQKLTELRGEVDCSTIIGDFNTSLSIMNRTTREKIKKGDLNNTMSHLEKEGKQKEENNEEQRLMKSRIEKEN